ncbi:N-acetylmuramoyl-L-alanine amidase, partial [Aquimarina celericrescens]|nr:N-acetylmuramoyl-L-alanine amidase [Aquimarina celericrescens]
MRVIKYIQHKTKITLLVLLIVFSFESIAQVVVIDPGHGYAANGITDPDGRTDTEHATALSVGLKLRSRLQNSCGNWTVRMTRTTRNGWISLTQRRTMSNNWRADRFISIHCNGGGGSGTETFWCNRSNSRDADNSRFSREVQNRMVEKGQWRDRRSVEDASYIFHLGVLTGNNAIGVLNEIGFVDSGDKNKLLNDTWRNRFADAYVAALQNSLGNCSGGGTPPPPPPPSTDTTPPTTSISASGGNTQTGDFTANFNDNDNVGVTRRFYQALEKYGDNWYAN